MEKIKGQCPCGQRLTAVIMPDGTLCFYVWGPPWVLLPRLITRCPVCGRDFSQITAEQLKDNAWGS